MLFWFWFCDKITYKIRLKKEVEKMKYLPATVAALGICAAVCYAVFITKSDLCLWGLLTLFIPYWMIPFQDDER